MNTRTAGWLAWSLCAVCAALIALALLLDFVTPETFPFRSGLRPGPVLAVLTGVLSLAYPTVGALIVSRVPANPIGWIFCSLGLLLEAQRFTTAYADYALLGNPGFPWGETAAWFTTWLGLAGPVLAGVFLMLLFPKGQLPSRRWWIVAWAAIFGAALTALGDALMPGHLRTHQYVENPFGVVGVIGGRFTTYEVFALSIVLGTMLLATSALAALFSLILRLHRAQGDERQQLKWFLYAAVPAVVFLSPLLLDAMLVNFTTNFVGNPRYIGSHEFLTYSIYVAVCASLVIPIFTYIAILRYHLYDIDRIINRTLVYGSLTAFLALAYFGGVTATQTVLQALTTQEELPQLIIVASTLLIAALFSPLRRGIQSFIDRRFYRRKYDARRTLETFSATLRDETDLEALNDDLLRVVTETMQPAHVSMWLRSDTASKGQPNE